ncbi:MAG: outer membrane beta-barrel protein [Deltaproteobacteria bacterium]|nr:outer membrane beta-barrel protein [Deltaproteobacteria bacterium]
MKTIPRNNSTIKTGLVAFLLLSIAFSSFFFLKSSQLTRAFAEQKQSNVRQVRLYSLVKRNSFITGDKRSPSNNGQAKNPSTKPAKSFAALSIQKPSIEIRKLILAPTCETDTKIWSDSHINAAIQTFGDERETASEVESGNLKQNAYSNLKLSKTKEDTRKTPSDKIVNGENLFGIDKKFEGAAGTLGDFFEGVSSTPSKGAYRIEITPRITVQEEYDDNIFLRNTNIVSDYTTTLSPGIKLVANSDTNGVDLDYELGWVKYHKGTRNDYIRHSGGLKLWQQLGNHLKIQLEDYYIKSDDILAAINQIPVSQRIPQPETLQAYQANRARALLEYQFGPGKQISAGYKYNITDNKDPNLEDTTEYGPFAKLAYWFSQKDGLEFDYTFSRYDYGTKGTAAETRPDLDSHDVLGRYIHRFAEKTSALAQYGLFIRNFPDVSVSYQIHDFSAGFDHAFSKRTAVTLGGGYYRATGDTNIKPGYNFLAAINRTFERGVIYFSATHSFDQGYNEVVPRGFTVYSEGLLRGNYTVTEKLNLYGNLSYRRNDYSNDDLDIIGGETTPDDQTYRGRFGFNWNIYRWVSLDLGYQHTKRISDDPEYDFDDNRVTLKLTGSYPYKW